MLERFCAIINNHRQNNSSLVNLTYKICKCLITNADTVWWEFALSIHHRHRNIISVADSMTNYSNYVFSFGSWRVCIISHYRRWWQNIHEYLIRICHESEWAFNQLNSVLYPSQLSQKRCTAFFFLFFKSVGHQTINNEHCKVQLVLPHGISAV